MTKHLARILVDMEFLRKALQFPTDTIIRRVYTPEEAVYYHLKPHFEIIVEHSDLPVVDDGNTIPLISPELETDCIEIPKFKSWGVFKCQK